MTNVTKQQAKAALADLLELCKNAPEPRWSAPFRIVMDFINLTPIAPPAPAYEFVGPSPAKYDLLGPAKPAGTLADSMREDGLGTDLIVYSDRQTGQAYVRTKSNFEERMRRIG